MDGRSSSFFSTKARLGSFATQLEDAAAAGRLGSSDPDLLAVPSWALGGIFGAVVAADEKLSKPPNPPKSSPATDAAGGLTAAAAGDTGVKLLKASWPNRLLAGNVLKLGWPAFDVVGTVTGAGGGIISAPVDEVSCSRGVPSACRRLCSRTEFDHDQASGGDSKVCQIDVFQVGTPGLPTYARGRRGEPGHGMHMHMHIQWHMHMLWEKGEPAARASGPALDNLSYRCTAVGRK